MTPVVVAVGLPSPLARQLSSRRDQGGLGGRTPRRKAHHACFSVCQDGVLRAVLGLRVTQPPAASSMHADTACSCAPRVNGDGNVGPLPANAGRGGTETHRLGCVWDRQESGFTDDRQRNQSRAHTHTLPLAATAPSSGCCVAVRTRPKFSPGNVTQAPRGARLRSSSLNRLLRSYDKSALRNTHPRFFCLSQKTAEGAGVVWQAWKGKGQREIWP